MTELEFTLKKILNKALATQKKIKKLPNTQLFGEM
jgi:hypothetical protein